jgi:hypothetical protein
MEYLTAERTELSADNKLQLLCKELEEETSRFLVKVEQLEKLLKRTVK